MLHLLGCELTLVAREERGADKVLGSKLSGLAQAPCLTYRRAMKETTIAMENAGQGLRELVSRARREHTTFVVVDAATPVARLIPEPEPRCTGEELAKVMTSTDLSSAEAQAWVNDLKQARVALNAPEDKWR